MVRFFINVPKMCTVKLSQYIKKKTELIDKTVYVNVFFNVFIDAFINVGLKFFFFVNSLPLGCSNDTYCWSSQEQHHSTSRGSLSHLI